MLEDDEEGESIYLCVCACVLFRGGGGGGNVHTGYLASQGPTGPLACGHLHMVH